MKRLLVGTLISAATLAVVATVVFAVGVKHRSTVKIAKGSTPVLIHGIVRSSAHPCEANRKVQVLIGSTASQQLVRTVHTSDDGHWKVAFNTPKPGRYQAKAVRSTYTKHGENNVCKPARSDKVDIA